MKDLRQKLLATFQVEHNEHVKQIRESLTALEASSTPPDLDEMFRRAHSLKGAARAVDLRPIEMLAHRLETLFARLREGALSLETPVARVICQALDASEDLLAANGNGHELPDSARALAAIDTLLGTSTPARAASTPAPPIAPVDKPAPPAAAAALGPQADTLRVNAESLDRIVSSAGQLLTETLRQNDVTGELRRLSQRLADAAAERERTRQSGARVFQQLDSSPDLAAAARYVNYIDHQVQTLSKQLRGALELQTRNAWTLRSLAGELQRDVRQARMIPAGNVFDAFRKMVRDLAKDVGKGVEIHMSGLQVEADRIVLQALKDPVMHVLRNAVSHGIEPEAERKSKGKRADGRIDLAVEVRGNQLTIAVDDDGQGVDVARVSEIAIRKGLLAESDAAARAPEDLMRLVLLPGFSTARSVTEVSGRGMGLSVVAQAVARLQGTVEIGASTHGGTRVSISAPLSVASQRLLLVSNQGRTLAVPLHGVARLHRLTVDRVRSVESRPVVDVAGDLLPIVSLSHLLNTGEPTVSVNQNVLCVMELRAGTRRLAVAVDAFLSERDAIIKDLPAPAGGNPRVAGGMLLEDGSVCLVLNPAELVEGFRDSANALVLAKESDAPRPTAPALEILVVDDSLTTRMLEKSVLEAHGYQVAIAVDGVDALNYLRASAVGLVISDLQMPRLDGFGLIAEMKRDPRLARIPFIFVSSVENPEDQARGMTLGADAYIVKRKFEQQQLLETIRQVL